MNSYSEALGRTSADSFQVVYENRLSTAEEDQALEMQPNPLFIDKKKREAENPLYDSKPLPPDEDVTVEKKPTRDAENPIYQTAGKESVTSLDQNPLYNQQSDFMTLGAQQKTNTTGHDYEYVLTAIPERTISQLGELWSKLNSEHLKFGVF